MNDLASHATWTDAQLALSWIPTLALAVSLSASAGLRAFLPMLVAGGLSRLGLVTLGEHFQFLQSAPALVVFGVATVLEVAGDKIPAVDHALDVAGTFVRPLAGSLLAASVMWQVDEPLWACVLGVIVGAPTALAPHAAKAATRAASSTFTVGFANPVLSVMEDVGSTLVAVLAVLVPIATVVLLALTALVAFLMFRRMRRGRSPEPASARGV